MPKKVMGFFGTREGAGCTHMALSVANYLHSVEKWEVMYLELGDFSHLYPMFSDRVVEKSGDILYAYQGVFYLICPKEKEALRLLDAFDGMMVIDFGRFAKENPLLESRWAAYSHGNARLMRHVLKKIKRKATWRKWNTIAGM